MIIIIRINITWRRLGVSLLWQPLALMSFRGRPPCLGRGLNIDSALRGGGCSAGSHAAGRDQGARTWERAFPVPRATQLGPLGSCGVRQVAPERCPGHPGFPVRCAPGLGPWTLVPTADADSGPGCRVPAQHAPDCSPAPAPSSPRLSDPDLQEARCEPQSRGTSCPARLLSAASILRWPFPAPFWGALDPNAPYAPLARAPRLRPPAPQTPPPAWDPPPPRAPPPAPLPTRGDPGPGRPSPARSPPSPPGAAHLVPAPVAPRSAAGSRRPREPPAGARGLPTPPPCPRRAPAAAATVVRAPGAAGTPGSGDGAPGPAPTPRRAGRGAARHPGSGRWSRRTPCARPRAATRPPRHPPAPSPAPRPPPPPPASLCRAARPAPSAAPSPSSRRASCPRRPPRASPARQRPVLAPDLSLSAFSLLSLPRTALFSLSIRLSFSISFALLPCFPVFFAISSFFSLSLFSFLPSLLHSFILFLCLVSFFLSSFPLLFSLFSLPGL
jgi:hypothetical protein